ncbi:MAG: hypothetical protein K6T61_02840 [Bryobacteraceae bacterium]|nr:hypothetical protein [Bryobacteraceae bacterium]
MARNLSRTAASAFLGMLVAAALTAAPPAHISDGEESSRGVSPETGPTPLAADPVGAATSPLVWEPLTGRERWRYYWRETFASPLIVPRTGFPALVRHLRNDPEGWGQGASAYSVRLADRYGRFFLRQSIESAGAAALRHDPWYAPSGRTSLGGRVLHAVTSAFLTRDSAGRMVPHWSRYGAIVTAEYLGNAWMPPGYRTTEEAWRGIGIQFGITASFNLVREFTSPRPDPWKGRD